MTAAVEWGVRLLFGASAALWAFALWRVLCGQPLVAARPRTLPPWGLLDVGLTLFLALLFGLIAQLVLIGGSTEPPAGRTPQEKMLMLVVSAGAQLAACVAGLDLAARRHRASAAECGIHWHALGEDLRLGAIGFFMIAPPALALQSALTQLYPSEHPLAQSFQEHPSAAMFVAAAAAAVLAAPVGEEILFRVLLLGALERVAAAPSQAATWLWGRGSTDETPVAPHEQPSFRAPAATPLIASSAIFAGLHLSHGPDAIPLFFFALGLGFLYQRTGSILSCIMIHLLLNAFSMLMLLAGAGQ